MKKLFALVLSLVLLLQAVPVMAQEESRVFVDSLGREVVVDREITRIAVTAPLAQIVVFALAPDMLVGIAEPWNDSAVQYINEQYTLRPVLGQLYGGKGGFNLEELLSVNPQVVIDIGEPKDSAAEDLDALSEQTGIPFVHISAYIDRMDEAYAKLGELLGLEEQAAVLGEYLTSVYDRSQTLSQQVEKARLLYVLGENGLNVLAKGSYHSPVIDMMADNLAVVDHPVSRGTGNEVDMEQMLLWNPDVVIFANDSIYDTVADDPLWQSISAIQSGAYYEAPVGPYNWMGFPPSAQRFLGMMWLGKLLYPEQADYDLYEEVARYFDLFYHCTLTPEQYAELMKKSLPASELSAN